MPFTNKVDYIPNMPSEGYDPAAVQEQKKIQKKRWQVLVGVFLFVVILANIFIWTRAPEFQSQAIMHFSYTSQNAEELDYIAQQQLSLNQKRLTSNSTLQSLSLKLREDHNIDVNIQQLRDMLSATTSETAKTITLQTTGTAPEVLKPVLQQWLSLYMSLLEQEQISKGSNEALQFEQQLEALEQKITAQKQVVEVFSEANNIISVEREENVIPNKIKGLSDSLEEAEAQKAQALAELDSLNASLSSGQQVERPIDRPSIDANRVVLQELEAELSELSERYTQQYLQRDPEVVAKQQKAKALKAALADQIADSQLLYLQDSQRNLAASVGKVNSLREQLADAQEQAQKFDQKLAEYRRLDDMLKALQLQASTLHNQLVEQEVSKPFDAKISILEPPFTPEYPVGPDYWQYSLISVIAAMVLAVAALLLFSFIVRKNKPAAGGANFVVLPGEQQALRYPELHGAEQAQLAANAQALQLGTRQYEPNQLENIRLLSTSECQALYGVANKQGKVVIGLLLSGVSATDLTQISKNDFMPSDNTLQITGAYARKILLSSQLSAIMEQLCAGQQPDNLLWLSALSVDDLSQIIINAGHDAELPYPEQLSAEVLRHTYLTYLVNQGVRLNDLEQLAGYLKPAELGKYRSVNRHGKSVDIDKANALYPYTVSESDIANEGQ
ncbi:hypothetical protein FX988_03102 [Paraglaciecola mesophila]|uniref:Tyr recombinase domain-containing protein n=1 Tax=Paraglaciecola mesophila TaxID=197222 RepID=A0A857JQL9_9ALTE|nr:hypothetical protein [Paraglaciecola mesophila]QHJ12844.1 hypothetical protein FX988_03102 [Paraglaciecola mesophila]